MAENYSNGSRTPTKILDDFAKAHQSDSKDTEIGTVAGAIDEIRPKLEKLECLKAVEYLQHIGPYELKHVAVFDDRKITEAAVRKLILSGESYDPNVIFMTEKQFYSIFS